MIISALGITFCGFSISPAIVDSDSNPEYIQMPTLSATPTPPISELPGSRIVLNGLCVPVGEADDGEQRRTG